jgi:RNA polymerase sigma-70 factor, ECF subfamily
MTTPSIDNHDDEQASQIATPALSDAALVERMRRGDEDAFLFLVTRYHTALVRLARAYVRDEATAEEVAQETWLAVLRGIDRFEGRSSLKTWLFRILVNRAKTRGVRDGRIVPFSSLDAPEGGDSERDDDARFFPPDDPTLAGHWMYPPERWDTTPEELALSAETRQVIQEAINALPPTQRQVITLRDIEGWSAEEVCNALGLSETNGRVLLHRARSKVRAAVERYLEKEPVG